MKKPIEQEFNCSGYFGFGSGAEMSRTKTALENVRYKSDFKKDMYCNNCPLAEACWNKHKERVKYFTPDLAAHIDKIALVQADYQEYMKGGGVDPYLSVMMGNMQDGAFVVATGKPVARQDMTLPYPFTEPGKS